MMRRYGRWVWLAFLFAFAAIFFYFEMSALNNDGLTLSRFIYNANQAFPLVGVLFGMLSGGLAVHFFWHWDPAAQERIRELEAEIARLKRQGWA